MKALALLVLASSPALAGKKVTFGDEPIPAGLEVDSTASFDATMSVTVSMEGQEQAMETRRSQREARKVRVLTVGADGVESYEIGWTMLRHSESGLGPDMAEDMPVVGITFVVDDAGARRSDGEPLTHHQRRFFEGLDDPFEGVRGLSGDIAGRKLKVGQVVSYGDMLPSVGLPTGPDSDTTFEGTATLREVREQDGAKVGVFDLALSAGFTQTDDGSVMNMGLELGGVLIVDVQTGWIRAMDTTGPFTLSARNTAAMEMSGKGTFNATQANSFVR